MSYYPRYVYNIDENITRKNMQDYDRKQKAIENKCLELDPDYFKRNLRERIKLRDKAEELIGGDW